jgi:uncharacterized phage protein gp47/JayE
MTSTYTSAGVQLDRYADILAEFFTSAKSTWGDSVDLSDDDYIGHAYRLLSVKLGELGDVIQGIYDAGIIANASGTHLDNNVALVGIERASAAYSTGNVTFTVNRAVVIPAGFQVKTTETEIVFETDDELIIAAAGTGSVDVTAINVGVNEAAAGEITKLVSTLFGVTAVTNAAAVTPGRLRGTDAEVRADHSAAVATSGEDDSNGIYEAVDALSTVSATYVFDNDTGQTVDGVPTGSVHVSAIGGTASEIATAISNNKTCGVQTHGAQTVTLYNETTRQSKDIHYDIAATVPIYISLVISTPGNYPDDFLAQIRANLIAHFDLLQIKDTVDYKALMAPIYQVNGIVVETMTIGTSPAPSGTSDLTMTALQRPTIISDNISIQAI